MTNPDCQECHGTGIYRGSLTGFPEPCSICSRSYSLDDPDFHDEPIDLGYLYPKED